MHVSSHHGCHTIYIKGLRGVINDQTTAHGINTIVNPPSSRAMKETKALCMLNASFYKLVFAQQLLFSLWRTKQIR